MMLAVVLARLISILIAAARTAGMTSMAIPVMVASIPAAPMAISKRATTALAPARRSALMGRGRTAMLLRLRLRGMLMVIAMMA